MHKAQKTPAILNKLKTECKTEVVLVPPGCTSLVQPLDVAFNAEFKSVIDQKCRISVPIDDNGDAGINIRGLEGYIVRNVDTDLESEEENMFELYSSDDESLTA